MSKRSILLTIASVTGLALLTLGSSAFAKDGDVLVRGTCAGKSASKLKLSAENGVKWNVVLTRNGARVAQLARVTQAPSGSFSARRLLANPAGPDVIRATAHRAGETCSARATFRV